MKKYLLLLIILILLITSAFLNVKKASNNSVLEIAEKEKVLEEKFPMFIQSLREREYPESEIIIEETLENGANYKKYIASYKSDNLKIYGLLTVPLSQKPLNGYPVILFLHGFIQPKTYITARDYVATQDALASAGFVTFKPDLRGHGKSEGQALGAHFSEAYVVDTLNAISSLKLYKDVNAQKLGIWGHSNGGEIGLRTMVISKDVKAGVFWAGVVGSFEDMLETYNSKIPFLQRPSKLVEEKGKPSENPSFWNKLDPYSYLKDISGSIQLHHGTNDTQVPKELSIHLKNELEKEGKTVEYYEYEGADHNLSGSFSSAMQRSIEFFNKNL